MAFHEVRFPIDISKGSSGGPQRVTDVVTLRSGFEQRNTIWSDSRRSYDAGLGLRTLRDLYETIEFFEGRRGRLHGFRWRDWADYRSGNPLDDPTEIDIVIGTGDGSQTQFQLTKTYDATGPSPYTRDITKPVSGTVVVALDGSPTTAFTVDNTTGLVTMDSAPGSSVSVTAGFEFDVPVRFDQDNIEVNVEHFNAGAIPTISILEIRV